MAVSTMEFSIPWKFGNEDDLFDLNKLIASYLIDGKDFEELKGILQSVIFSGELLQKIVYPDVSKVTISKQSREIEDQGVRSKTSEESKRTRFNFITHSLPNEAYVRKRKIQEMIKKVTPPTNLEGNHRQNSVRSEAEKVPSSVKMLHHEIEELRRENATLLNRIDATAERKIQLLEKQTKVAVMNQRRAEEKLKVAIEELQDEISAAQEEIDTTRRNLQLERKSLNLQFQAVEEREKLCADVLGEYAATVQRCRSGKRCRRPDVCTYRHFCKFIDCDVHGCNLFHLGDANYVCQGRLEKRLESRDRLESDTC
jgi:hypothetical protein